jgi:uncharacterized integral membrane protein
MYTVPIIILVVILFFSIMAVINRTDKRKEFRMMSEEAKTFEDKLLLLQHESNRRLKDIDTTLDWFFWIMIIGGVLFLISLFISSMSSTVSF